MWSSTLAPEAKEFLQGLIQLSAAMVKRRGGNRAGAAKLVDRALARLERARTLASNIARGVRLDPLIEQIRKGVNPEIELNR